MNEYKVGRDLQKLRSRLDQLESHTHHHGADECACRQQDGVSRHQIRAGVALDQEPEIWKAKKELMLPPALYRILGVPDRSHQYNIMPESKTWPCQPEPLMLYVAWNDGTSDEFYRLQNQVFSVIRVTEPNSGHISCTAIYSARFVASGRGHSHYRPATSSLSGYMSSSRFAITLRDSQGGSLGGHTSYSYSIACNENREFYQSWNFNAGLYELVAGATWEVLDAQQIDRC